MPSEFYPNDPHKDNIWPLALGSLTSTGTKTMYKLGQILHKRYNTLLPDDGIYSSKNMYVRSSYAERCLMSAQAFLAGFIVPKRSSLPFSWQPVAVNSLPRNQDNVNFVYLNIQYRIITLVSSNFSMIEALGPD